MRSRLGEGEEALLVVNKHWITLAVPALVTACLAAIPGILLSTGYQEEALWGAIPFGIGFLYISYAFVARRYDLWIVTTDRVIDEEGVFTHSAKESPLDKIHNVSCKQPLLGHLFGYGHVEIQTAAEKGATKYSFVSFPKKLKDAISHAQARKQGGLPPSALSTETRECPYCAETIKAKAIVCRYCGGSLEAGAKA